MNLKLTPGKYVVAVSGGVDSVALLNLLSKAGHMPVVAHFDHGIRENSSKDRKFVEDLARQYGLEFFYEEGGLGPDSSEALAREKRYEFLEKIKKQTGSEAIVTAHHQDDVLETVVINLIRGTGRKGLSSLKDRPGLIRPLLKYTKSEILDYAKHNKLKWREDETNTNENYLRNYVRHSLLAGFSQADKNKLLRISSESAARNLEIDKIISDILINKDEIPRSWLASLSHGVASEVMAEWLRKHDARLDKKTVERLVIGLKTAKENKKIQVNGDRYFVINKGIIRMNTSVVV